jgi:outer membrane protein OmpA-like peptidoglycan-associated protein
VGNIEGSVVDAKTNQPIPAAKIKIIDKLNRALELQTDGRGAFRFERVPEGTARLIASADDYLATAGEWRIELQKDTPATISMFARPKRPNVTVAQKELVLKGAIAFEQNTAAIAPASMSLVEEIADLLQRTPELLLLEIQVQGTSSGDDALSLTLSRERANSLREAMIRVGVAGSRLRANASLLPGARLSPQKPGTLAVPKVRIAIEQRKGVEPPKPTAPAAPLPKPTVPAAATPAAPAAPAPSAALPEARPPVPPAAPTPPPSGAPSAAPAPTPSAPKASPAPTIAPGAPAPIPPAP